MKVNTLLFAIIISCVAPASIFAQVITTIAGSAISGFSGDGGPATSAAIDAPRGIYLDGAGNIYFAVSENRIRMINPAGIITTVAGSSSISGFGGDGGPATDALLSLPLGVTFDALGNMYIGDAGNNRLRKINTSGVISTIAGSSTTGGFSGDGGPATNAHLNIPRFIYVDVGGNVFFTDAYNCCVRKINSSGIISTIAGIGGVNGFSGDGGPATNAKLSNGISGVCADAIGNIYVADVSNHRIRKIDVSGIITTFAGGGTTLGDGGPATAAQFLAAEDIAFDAIGNMYVAEIAQERIRKINTSGIISTIAGTGIGGFSGDGGPPTAARLSSPSDVCLNSTGDIFISDETNDRIRKICIPPATAVISGASTVCEGASTPLSASLPGGTWAVTTGHASVSPGGVVTGISGGADTIRYVLTNSCYFSAALFPITVNPLPSPGAISGADSICPGLTVTLTSTVAGGAWSSPSPLVSVGSATGMVTGISLGTAVISYAVTNSCGTAYGTFTMYVTSTPAVPPITGPSVLCMADVSTSDTLHDALPGGHWSTTPGILSVGSATGIVTGSALGTGVITYTVTNSCGTASATHMVTVMGLPAIASITGPSALCKDSLVTLLDSIAGGTWSTSSPGTASIGSATGIATGLATGIDTIRYTTTNVCGSVTVYTLLHVTDCSHAGVAGVALPPTMQVYPNPAAGQLYVTVPVAAGTLRLQDVSGRTLLSQPVSHTTSVIEVRTLPRGIYFVQWQSDAGAHETQKIALE